MLYTLLFLGLFRIATAASSADHLCADYLGVPVKFIDKFAAYTNLKYVTPMGHLHGTDSIWGHHITVTSLDTPGLSRSKVTASLEYGFEGQDFTTVDPAEVHMRSEMAPDFTYRVLFALLLDKWPNIQSINLFVFHGPEHGTLRDQLARGISIEDAIRTAPSYHALEAFGFRLDSVEAPHPDPEDLFFVGETLIVMKMTRSPDPARLKSLP